MLREPLQHGHAGSGDPQARVAQLLLGRALIGRWPVSRVVSDHEDHSLPRYLELVKIVFAGPQSSRLSEKAKPKATVPISVSITVQVRNVVATSIPRITAR
jgi:hypothetical protein